MAQGTTLALGLVLAALLSAPLTARVDRIRATHQEERSLLEEAVGRSTIVRDLAADIEESDLLVFLVGSREPGVWRGGTKLFSSRGTARMLAVTINLSLAPAERIAVLGHELQHVREVAADSAVVDQDGMRQLFGRIGFSNSRLDHFETAAAQDVERRVRQELAREFVHELPVRDIKNAGVAPAPRR